MQYYKCFITTVERRCWGYICHRLDFAKYWYFVIFRNIAFCDTPSVFLWFWYVFFTLVIFSLAGVFYDLPDLISSISKFIIGLSVKWLRSVNFYSFKGINRCNCSFNFFIQQSFSEGYFTLKNLQSSFYKFNGVFSKMIKKTKVRKWPKNYKKKMPKRH